MKGSSTCPLEVIMLFIQLPRGIVKKDVNDGMAVYTFLYSKRYLGTNNGTEMLVLK